MNRISMVGLSLVAVLMCSNASAQDAAVSTADVSGGDKTMAVGGYITMGMAHEVGDLDDAKFRFAGGGGAYFDFSLTPLLALEAGLGLVGKGAREEGTIDITDPAGNVIDTIDYDARLKFVYLTIPLGVMLNINGLQIGAAWEIAFALAGKSKTESGGNEDEHKWDGDDWDNFRRFNMGPRIRVGYAIPVGPISIVPGIYWSLHVLNENTGDNSDDYAMRAMNIMFLVAVEFGL
jgi:hypothetical protein